MSSSCSPLALSPRKRSRETALLADPKGPPSLRRTTRARSSHFYGSQSENDTHDKNAGILPSVNCQVSIPVRRSAASARAACGGCCSLCGGGGGCCCCCGSGSGSGSRSGGRSSRRTRCCCWPYHRCWPCHRALTPLPSPPCIPSSPSASLLALPPPPPPLPLPLPLPRPRRRKGRPPAATTRCCAPPTSWRSTRARATPSDTATSSATSPCGSTEFSRARCAVGSRVLHQLLLLLPLRLRLLARWARWARWAR